MKRRRKPRYCFINKHVGKQQKWSTGVKTLAEKCGPSTRSANSNPTSTQSPIWTRSRMTKRRLLILDWSQHPVNSVKQVLVRFCPKSGLRRWCDLFQRIRHNSSASFTDPGSATTTRYPETQSTTLQGRSHSPCRGWRPCRCRSSLYPAVTRLSSQTTAIQTAE